MTCRVQQRRPTDLMTYANDTLLAVRRSGGGLLPAMFTTTRDVYRPRGVPERDKATPNPLVRARGDDVVYVFALCGRESPAGGCSQRSFGEQQPK